MSVPIHSAMLSPQQLPQTNAEARARDLAETKQTHGVDTKLQQAAKEFEAVFLRQMLTALERTTKVGSSGPHVAGQQTYGTMVVEAVADAIASVGGLGLAKTISSALTERVAPPTNDSQPRVELTPAKSAQGLSSSAVPNTEIRTTIPTSLGHVADRRIR